MARTLVLLAALTALAAPPEKAAAAENVNGLKYFGYFASTIFGCGAASPYSHTSEIADHSNVAFVGCGGIAEIKAEVDNAACHNMRSIVGAQEALFDQNGSTFTLKSNWKISLANFLNTLGSSLNSVVAFYPIDEPNGKISEASLGEVIQEFHRLAPSKAVLGIYANAPKRICYQADNGGWGIVNGDYGRLEGGDWYCYMQNMPALSNYDWVGIDCYSGGRYGCTGLGDLLPYGRAISWIKSFLRTDQRIVLVPQSGVGAQSKWPDAGGYYLTDVERGNVAKRLEGEIGKYHTLAKSDSQIIGMLSFTYQNFPSGLCTSYGDSSFYGLESFPELRSIFAEIGKSVVANSGLPATGCRAATIVNDILLR